MTSVQLIARNKEWSIGKSTVLFRLVLGKEKLNSVVTRQYEIKDIRLYQARTKLIALG